MLPSVRKDLLAREKMTNSMTRMKNTPYVLYKLANESFAFLSIRFTCNPLKYLL